MPDRKLLQPRLNILAAAALTLLGSLAGRAQETSASGAGPLRLDDSLSRRNTPNPAPPAARAGAPEGTGTQLRLSHRLTPAARGNAARQLPIYIEADALEGRSDGSLAATGNARLRRGSLTLRADKLQRSADNTVRADGNVRIDKQGDIYTGPQLELQIDSGQGYFLSPHYRFARTGAGGQAERFDFIDDQHAVATGATYSSCTPEDGEHPAWELTTSRVAMDFDNDVGVAEDAVVHFYGLPILGAPRMSFPLSDRRKSGWLPPSFDINNRSGFELQIPFYWNIAPQHDATITPTFASRRGAGIDTEFRYLERNFSGEDRLTLLPHDKLENSERWLAQAYHKHDFGGDTQVHLSVLRASDDNYWKDFPRSATAETYWKDSQGNLPALTPRLLNSAASIEQQISPGTLGLGHAGVWNLSWFARVQDWQVLRLTDPTDTNPADQITPPYRRAPQLGLQGSGDAHGWQWQFDTQINRFTNEDPALPGGTRVHALTRLAYPLEPMGPMVGWTITPSLRVNAASYAMDDALANGSKSTGRVIPSFSLDSAWVFERPSRWFDSDYVQTLEPRVQYLRTPYRDQSNLPNFDSAPLDFNVDTIYFDNSFSGVDRVSDANQLSLGLTTRIINPGSGAELLRLGAVQRYLLDDQRITPDGQPLTQHLSDLLLLGSTSVIPNWTVATTAQYNSTANNFVNTTLSARYSPGPWRTVSATFRETRGASKQLDLGWQWPIAGRMPPLTDSAPSGSGDCRQRTWYSVGRFNYNLLDHRITDSLLGLEYDGGCWVGRIVSERISTGQAEATTRLMFQLELVGLSRLGSSPLRALKDNIPGYRLLREIRGVVASPESPEPFSSSDD